MKHLRSAFVPFVIFCSILSPISVPFVSFCSISLGALTNLPAPAALSVMVDTNNAIVAPTNMTAADFREANNIASQTNLVGNSNRVDTLEGQTNLYMWRDGHLPATGDWDGGGNALTNWYKVQATTGVFDKVVVSSNSVKIGTLNLGAGGTGSNLLVNGEAVTLKSTSDSLQSQLTANDADIADLAADNAGQDQDLIALAMWIAMEQDAERYALKRSVIYEFSDTGSLAHASCSNLYHDSGGDYIYSSYANTSLYWDCHIHLPCNDSNTTSVVTNKGRSGQHCEFRFQTAADSEYATQTVSMAQSGKLGGSLFLDCTDGDDAGYSIKCPSNHINQFRNSHTFAFWVKMEDGRPSHAGAFTGGRKNADEQWRLYSSTAGAIGTLHESNNQQAHETAGSVIFGDGLTPWVHIAAVVDEAAETVTWYSNAVSVDVIDISAMDLDNYDADMPVLYFGTYYHADGVPPRSRDKGDMWMDDIRFYSDALLPGEISQIYNSGTGTTNHPTRDLGGNLTMISLPYYVDAAPSTGSLRIMGLTNTTTTLNTDIKGYISSDGGSTWDQVTLADEGVVYKESLAYRWWAGSTNYTGASTSLVWKITTHNNMDDIRIITVGQGYDD